MLDGRVLPSLGESTVVPDVSVVGETVANETELALLDVLLDRVERLFLGDLHLGVGPSGYLNDHVEDGLGLIGEEGDVAARLARLSFSCGQQKLIWQKTDWKAEMGLPFFSMKTRCSAKFRSRMISRAFRAK